MPIFGRRKDAQAKQSQAINDIIADLDGWVIEQATVVPSQGANQPLSGSTTSPHRQLTPRTPPPLASSFPSGQTPQMPPIPSSPPATEAGKKQPTLKGKKSGIFRYFGRSESSSSTSSAASTATTDPSVDSTPETSPNYATTTFAGIKAPRRVSSSELRSKQQEGFTVGRKPRRPSTANTSSSSPHVSRNASETSLDADHNQRLPAAPAIGTRQRAQRSQNYEGNSSSPSYQQHAPKLQELLPPPPRREEGSVASDNGRSGSLQHTPSWDLQAKQTPPLIRLQIPHSSAPPEQTKRSLKIMPVAEQLAAASDDEQNLRTVVAPQSRQQEQALHRHREDDGPERMVVRREGEQRSAPRETSVRETTSEGRGSPPSEMDRHVSPPRMTTTREVEALLLPKGSQQISRQRSFERVAPPRAVEPPLERTPSPLPPPRASPAPSREEPAPTRESLLAPRAPPLAPPRKPAAVKEEPSWYVSGPTPVAAKNPLDMYSSLFNTTLRDDTAVSKGRRKAGPARPSTGGGASRNTAPIGRNRSGSAAGTGMDLADVNISARGVASGLAPTQPLALRKRNAASAAPQTFGELRTLNAEGQQQTFHNSSRPPIRRPATASTVQDTWAAAPTSIVGGLGGDEAQVQAPRARGMSAARRIAINEIVAADDSARSGARDRPSTAATPWEQGNISRATVSSRYDAPLDEGNSQARMFREKGSVPPLGGGGSDGNRLITVERHGPQPASASDPPRRRVKPSRSLTDIKTEADAADPRTRAKADAIWGGGVDLNARVAAGIAGIGMRRFAADPGLSLTVN